MSRAARLKRKQIRQLQNEAAWLQKAMFALQKAETARAKFADTTSDELRDYVIEMGDGSRLALEELDDALDARVRVIREMTKERRQVLR